MLQLSTPTSSFIARAEGLKAPNISQIELSALQLGTPTMSLSLALLPQTQRKQEIQNMREIQKLVNVQIAAMEVITYIEMLHVLP